MAVTEKRKIQFQAILDEFIQRKDVTEHEFPTDLTNPERALIHKQCQRLGLFAKSRGSGQNRYLTIFKQRRENVVGNSGVNEIPDIKILNPIVSNNMAHFVTSNKLSRAEERLLTEFGLYHPEYRPSMSFCLALNAPAVPPRPKLYNVARDVMEAKLKLPIQEKKNEFLETTRTNQVILVVGETGSGKSTQIAQFILEQNSTERTRCRVVVCEPRRIAAVTLADRVACERGEDVGQVVGYQIRLESVISNRTLLTFCTNGVVLKTILCNERFFESITHLILDEVHERDKFTDYLLIILRDILPRYPYLKLILMSANLDDEKFSSYFHNCALFHVPGSAYVVRDYFLADVLLMTNYMRHLFEHKGLPTEIDAKKATKKKGRPSLFELTTIARDISLDEKLEKFWNERDGSEITGFVEDNVRNGHVDVNYQHSRSGITLLMIAAIADLPDTVTSLLRIGADRLLKSKNDWNAAQWAATFGNEKCLRLLSESALSELLVINYQSMMDDDQIDIGLILELIVYSCNNLPAGGLLVFLPGYESMLQVKEAMFARLDMSEIFLCLLHSQISASEQRKAFTTAAQGKRKVVLSTNIAEVSITVHDIRFVVDTGKMKQRSFDVINDVGAITTDWISKTNVTQRAGRAGRCQDGICFHLYTTVRYEAMPDAQVPEILRVPIHELCLQTKVLRPHLSSVGHFLAKALDPPSLELVRSSIQLLKSIGAFDADERLTILGRCLNEIPIDPQLGKMILYGALLHCLDPVITVAAALSYGEPFILPRDREIAEHSNYYRFQLSKSTPFSDHGLLLNAVYGWNEARAQCRERRFCRDHFLSNSAMQMIMSLRIRMLNFLGDQIAVSWLLHSGMFRLVTVAEVGLHRIEDLMYRALRSVGFGDGMTDDEFWKYRNENSTKWPVVKATITAGSYPNIALVDRRNGRLLTKNECASVNPSSILCVGAEGRRFEARRVLDNVPTEWVLFHEMMRQDCNMQAKYVTSIDTMSVFLFAGPCNVSIMNVSSEQIVNREMENRNLGENDGVVVTTVSVVDIDGWMKVRLDSDKAATMIYFREKMHASFLRQLADPKAKMTSEDKNILHLVVQLLCQESNLDFRV